MDPTAPELLVMANLGDCIAWVGMSAGLVEGMQEALGEVDNLRDVVAIPQPAWDAALAATRFVVSAHVAEVPERPWFRPSQACPQRSQRSSRCLRGRRCRKSTAL